MVYQELNHYNANIIGVMTSNNDLVPVKPFPIPIKELEKNKVLYMNRPLYHELDMKLANYTKTNFNVIDDRIKNVNKSKYLEESYQLFRFEVANILSEKTYNSYKIKLKNLINSKDSKEIEKLLTDLSLGNLENKKIGTELVTIIDELPNLSYYTVNNQRYICSNLDEHDCQKNLHCKYIVDTKVSKKPKCSFVLTKTNLYEFIKRLSSEICENEVKALEVLKEKKYFVSDIVDLNNFTEKPGQKIIKSTNTNLQKILVDIFGKEHVPKIGRRYLSKKIEVDLQTLQLENPLKDIKNAYSQNIIPYNYSIIRAYVNGYYWIKHKLYTVYARNLGFYSEIQNELINLFRSQIIDWLNIPDNINSFTSIDKTTKKILNNTIINSLEEDVNIKLIINKYIVKLMEKNIEDNLGLFELYLLNILHNIPIIYIINGKPTYHINNKIKIINTDNFDEELYKSSIIIGIDMNLQSFYPSIIESIYYK
jgi:hypothetical protein